MLIKKVFSRLALFCAALVLFGMGMPTDGVATSFATALSDPKKANEAYRSGDYAQAAELFRQAIEADPNDARLYFNLGNALSKDGKMEQAEEAYRQYQQLMEAPEDQALADYNLGTSLSELGELEDALEHLQHALMQNPNDEDAQFNYEMALKQMQQQEQQQQEQNQDQDGEQDQEQQDQQQQNKQDQQDQQNQQDQDQQNQQQDQQQQNQQDQQQQDQQQQNQQQQNSSNAQNQSSSRQGDALGEPKQLSKEEAANLLKALEQLEKNILKNQKKASEEPVTNEKDW